MPEQANDSKPGRDVQEQETPADPRAEPDSDAFDDASQELPAEADIADVLDQRRSVPILDDDEDDPLG